MVANTLCGMPYFRGPGLATWQLTSSLATSGRHGYVCPMTTEVELEPQIRKRIRPGRLLNVSPSDPSEPLDIAEKRHRERTWPFAMAFSPRRIEFYPTGRGPQPVLYFHGSPGIGDPMVINHQPTIETSLTVIGINRPGYGRSTPIQFRDARSVTRDARVVFDAAVWHPNRKVVLVARSGGSIYALAFAAMYPNLVKEIVLLAPQVPSRYVNGESVIGQNRAAGGTDFYDFVKSTQAIAKEIEGNPWALHEFLRKEVRTLQPTGPHPDLVELHVSGLRNEIFAALFRSALVGTNGLGWTSDGLLWQNHARGIDELIANVPRDIPMSVTYGAHDLFSQPAATSRFLDENFPDAGRLELKHHGHLYFGTHMDVVLSCIAEAHTRAVEGRFGPMREMREYAGNWLEIFQDRLYPRLYPSFRSLSTDTSQPMYDPSRTSADWADQVRNGHRHPGHLPLAVREIEEIEHRRHTRALASLVF
jgi:pimeloyl-ACP methyl ester carboxylesterase